MSTETMEGRFTAKFVYGADAKRFFDRLVADPGAEYAVPGSVKLAGRLVTWQADERAYEDHLRHDGMPGIVQYLLDMSETVGYYGSTFGEPPYGIGARTATLNGVACPASMLGPVSHAERLPGRPRYNHTGDRPRGRQRGSQSRTDPSSQDRPLQTQGRENHVRGPTGARAQEDRP